MAIALSIDGVAPSPEFQAFGDAITAVVAAIKAKDSVIMDVEALVAPLIPAVTALQNVGADVKLPVNGAYLVASILAALNV